MQRARVNPDHEVEFHDGPRLPTRMRVLDFSIDSAAQSGRIAPDADLGRVESVGAAALGLASSLGGNVEGEMNVVLVVVISVCVVPRCPPLIVLVLLPPANRSGAVARTI